MRAIEGKGGSTGVPLEWFPVKNPPTAEEEVERVSGQGDGRGKTEVWTGGLEEREGDF